MPHPLSFTTIWTTEGKALHSIWILSPFSVWSRAFFYNVADASDSQSRSQKRITLSEPDRRISFCSCLALYAKCSSMSPHHIRHIFRFLFNHNGTGIQFCDLSRFCTSVSMRSSSCSDKSANSFYQRRIHILILKQPVIDIQGCQRCFQLMRNIRNCIFQKFLFPKPVICMCILRPLPENWPRETAGTVPPRHHTQYAHCDCRQDTRWSVTLPVP